MNFNVTKLCHSTDDIRLKGSTVVPAMIPQRLISLQPNKLLQFLRGNFMGKQILAILFVATMLLSMLASLAYPPTNAQIEPTLDPSTIPKYVDQLVIPPVYVPTYTYDWKTRQVPRIQNQHERIQPTNPANSRCTRKPHRIWANPSVGIRRIRQRRRHRQIPRIHPKLTLSNL